MVNILLRAFHSPEENTNGTLRGLIALSFLFLFNLIYIYFISIPGLFTKYMHIFIAYFLSLVLIAFAIAVQIPERDTTPATTQVVSYGLCLGLVVYGFLSINIYTLFKTWSFLLRFAAFGIVSVTLSALFTYYCSEHANLL